MRNSPLSLVIFHLSTANIKATRECNALVRNLNIPIEMDHVPVLLYLYYNPLGSSQQKISLDLQREKASVNRTVTFLSKIALVSVDKNLQDKRATLVGLTPLGIEIAEKMLVALKDFDKSFVSALDQQEQDELIRLLNKLIG